MKGIVKCFAKHPETSKIVIIQRGTMGYFEAPEYIANKNADELNAEIGVTPKQAEAMLIGSMFGWNVPGAKIEE